MYTAIDIGQLAKYGVTYWLPLASAANVAQGAAALAVGVKSKDQKIKSLALPSSLSAFMGITEPAIFGVKILQTIYRRMYWWSMRSIVCITCTSRSKRNWSNRYLRYPALPESAVSVHYRDGNFSRSSICDLLHDLQR